MIPLENGHQSDASHPHGAGMRSMVDSRHGHGRDPRRDGGIARERTTVPSDKAISIRPGGRMGTLGDGTTWGAISTRAKCPLAAPGCADFNA